MTRIRTDSVEFRAACIVAQALPVEWTIFAVGGWPRDQFFGIESKDMDLEIHGASSVEEVVQALTSASIETFGVGKKFGVLKAKVLGVDLDISLARVDIRSGFGHTGFKVDFDVSKKEAFRRRDFTINAIGIDIRTLEIFDPFGGVRDIEDRVLRIVDFDTFIWDGFVRTLRGVQFCERMDLTADEHTVRTCSAFHEFEVDPERIWTEFDKLITKGTGHGKGLDFAFQTGVAAFFGFSFHIEIWSDFAKAKTRVERLTALATKLDKVGRQEFFEKTHTPRSLIFKVEESLKTTPLITGKMLISLGFTPGPIFSEIIEAVVEKQDTGEITTAEQAIEFAKDSSWMDWRRTT